MKAAACILVLLLSACALQDPRGDAPFFTHGVASGDMRGGSVVLWTRTREAARLVPELSATPAFEAPAALTAIDARADADFTARAIATALQPGTRYYYRFTSGAFASPVGTFRMPYAANDHAA